MGKMIAARQSGDNKRYTDEKYTKYAENKEINKEGDDPVCDYTTVKIHLFGFICSD
jgi:hypothetical protein